MKKFILCAVALAGSFFSFAQEKINEGMITYSVEYQLPDNMKQYAAFFPKEAVVYFKGDSAITIQKSAQSTSSMITNNKASFMRLLLEAGGKQVYVNFTPAEQEESLTALPEYTFTAGTETKTLANYKATKYELKDKKTGTSTEAWFTKDVSIVPNSLTMLFEPTYGVPLAFSSSQNGMTIKATVKEVKPGPVPAGAFSTPKTYESITSQQLRAMMGGR